MCAGIEDVLRRSVVAQADHGAGLLTGSTAFNLSSIVHRHCFMLNFSDFNIKKKHVPAISGKQCRMLDLQSCSSLLPIGEHMSPC